MPLSTHKVDNGTSSVLASSSGQVKQCMTIGTSTVVLVVNLISTAKKHCLASHFSSTGKLKQGRVNFITEALSRITSKTFDTSVSSLLENNSRNYSLNTLICENGFLR